MKTKIEVKGKYHLNVDETIKLLETFIVPNYPEFQFVVRKSEASDSIYIEIYNKKKRKILRISDHYLDAGLSYCIVNHSTKKIKIIRYIINT